MKRYKNRINEILDTEIYREDSKYVEALQEHVASQR
jgi:hypothetical protein